MGDVEVKRGLKRRSKEEETSPTPSTNEEPPETTPEPLKKEEG